jgi:F0F1-type ATP synthase membrane subunit b/b'
MEKKLTVLESAKKEAHQLVEKAEGAAQEHVRSMRWEIGSKMEDFQRRAASEVEGLSKVIVDRVKSISSSKGQSSLHSIFLFALLLLPTAYAHAAGGDGSAAITDLKWPWVNFAIYVALLTYLLRKPLAAAWSTRRSSFIDLIGAAQREAEQARQELSAAEAKIATLNTELVRVAADIEKEGVREAGDLITEAKKRAERIVAQGKDLALAEKRSTEESIRREIVEQALSRAEANLRSELNVDSDKPLRDAAVSAVRGLVQ